MSRTLLQTVSIDSNVLQMFSNKLSNYRQIAIEYTDSSKMMVKPVVEFRTNRFIDDENYENVIFQSIYNYYRATAHPLSHHKYVPLDDDYLQSLLAVLSTGELYHINGDTFYFKAPFKYDDFNYIGDRSTLLNVNSNKHIIRVDVNHWEGDLLIQATPSEEDYRNVSTLFLTARYTMSLDSIYDAIRRYSNVTATPQSIFKSLTSRLL